jgi:hypothetical protein
MENLERYYGILYLGKEVTTIYHHSEILVIEKELFKTAIGNYTQFSILVYDRTKLEKGKHAHKVVSNIEYNCW